MANELFKVKTGSFGADQKPIYDVFQGSEHIKDPTDMRLQGKDIASLPEGKAPERFKSVFNPVVPDSLDASRLMTDSQELSDLMAKNEALKLAEKEKSLLPKTAEPAALNLENKYSGLRTSYGIDDLNNRLTQKNQEILKLQDEFKAGSNAIEGQNKEMVMGAVRGEQAVLAKQSQEKLNGLLREKALMVDELSTKNSIISNIMDFAKSDYNTAKDAYDTKFSQNLQIQTSLENYKNDEERRSNEIKDTAKANLKTLSDMVSNGITKGTLNPSSLPGEIKLSIQKLELQSGFPLGSTLAVLKSLQPGQEEVLKQMSNDQTKYSVLIKNTDGTFETKTFSTGLPADRSVALDIQYKQAQINKINQEIKNKGDAGSLSYNAQAVIENPSLLGSYTAKLKGKVIAELQNAGYDTSNLGTKALSDTAIKEINQTNFALTSLNDLKTILSNNQNSLGPITGLAALNPWSQARKIQADIDRVKQTVGKALEGGVLRKEDEEKYKKILATITDTPETAIYKIDQLITSITKNAEDYKTLQEQGGRSSDVGASLQKKGSSIKGTTSTNINYTITKE